MSYSIRRVLGSFFRSNKQPRKEQHKTDITKQHELIPFSHPWRFPGKSLLGVYCLDVDYWSFTPLWAL